MKRKYYATGKIAYLDFLLPYWWGGYTRHDVEITPISYIFFSVAMMSSLFFGVINFARKWNLSSPSIARDGLGPHHPQAGRVLWPRRSTLRAIVAPPCTRPGRSWSRPCSSNGDVARGLGGQWRTRTFAQLRTCGWSKSERTRHVLVCTSTT